MQPITTPSRGTIGAAIGFRPDIQGLRTVAVLMVVVYHLWPNRLPGGYAGVDVFFVISGFLMTAVLLKHPPRRARDLADFWARRIRRLLPAGLAVLAATGIATSLVAPATIWQDTAKQIVASTFYVQNWVLAADSVDYLAADDAPSPLQHYWSLSVEEQFYLLWPLVLGAAGWWAARRAGRIGAVPAVVVVVFVASLSYSIWYTAVEPAGAYFITPTRIWELVLGGIVAVLPERSVTAAPATLRAVAAWVGLGAIAFTAVRYTAATPFPGYTALLPTVGTALVLWARPLDRPSPGRLLALRPVQYVGDISYSLYLWHWPIIALLPYVSGTVGLLDKTVALGASLVLAGLTKSFVEDPFRRPRSPRALRRTYQAGVAAMVVVGLAAGSWWWSVQQQVAAAEQERAAAEANAGACFGAAAIVAGFERCPQDPAVAPVPAPAAAKDDKSVAYRDNCWVYRPFSDRVVCHYGDGPVRVALVGNSHAGHWLPALLRIGAERGWAITTYLVSQCVPTSTRQQFDTAAMADGCADYGQWVLDETARGSYDLVITSNRMSVRAEGRSWAESEHLYRNGFADYLARWTADGTPVVVIRDTPYPGRTVPNIPDCLAEHPDDLSACAGTVHQWRWYYPFAEAAATVPGAHVVDVTRLFCADGICPAVIGGVTVYFDSSHITATYARSLAPYLGAEFDALQLPTG